MTTPRFCQYCASELPRGEAPCRLCGGVGRLRCAKCSREFNSADGGATQVVVSYVGHSLNLDALCRDCVASSPFLCEWVGVGLAEDIYGDFMSGEARLLTPAERAAIDERRERLAALQSEHYAEWAQWMLARIYGPL